MSTLSLLSGSLCHLECLQQDIISDNTIVDAYPSFLLRAGNRFMRCQKVLYLWRCNAMLLDTASDMKKVLWRQKSERMETGDLNGYCLDIALVTQAL